jgi:tetratricopeptide (TPR) repeat protein
MRKLSAGLLISAMCGLFTCQPGFLQVARAQEATVEASNKESAEILFAEALELKKGGNMAGALDSFARAIRLDRTILANDDQGLIDALKKDCEEKLKTSPDDVKMLELLGFVHAVCYSDYPAAIACYQKVYELVTDQSIKDRTEALIERLKLSAEVQQSYQQEVTASLRDERLKSWSEMERVERFGEETARMQQKSADLAEAYKTKDELSNRVPQLEQELKDLQDEYDKANRLFYTMSDNALYERRRRRLKDDIAEKEKEVESARKELDEAESVASELDKELASAEKAKEASPVKSY